MKTQPIPMHSGETIECGSCSKPADFAIIDASPVTYSCHSCMRRAVQHGLDCARLNRLKREISIPGSRVTTEEIREAKKKCEASLLAMVKT